MRTQLGSMPSGVSDSQQRLMDSMEQMERGQMTTMIMSQQANMVKTVVDAMTSVSEGAMDSARRANEAMKNANRG
jgi:methyl-accepting chemotaxis protein